MSEPRNIEVDGVMYKTHSDGAVFKVGIGMGSSPPKIGNTKENPQNITPEKLAEEIRKLISC